MRRSAPEIREDFIDPTEVWDPELSSPIPKLIGGLLTITLLLAFAVLGIKGHRVLVLSPILGFGYALGDIVPALERLRAFRRYEAWMAAPAPAPRHLGARIVGATLLAIIALELFLCWYNW